MAHSPPTAKIPVFWLPAFRTLMHISKILLAGHNRWTKIGRGKVLTDAARSITFAKLTKAISSAVRAGGADPASNLRLASVLDAARRASMPKDNIERALAKRGEGAAALSEGLLEGSAGPVAVLVSVLSDNMRRTLPEVRHIFTKHGGSLGSAGSQAFRFSLRGRVCVEVPAGGAPAEFCASLLEAALAAGAEDVDADEPPEATVWCAPSGVGALRNGLGAAGFKVTAAALTREPTALVAPPADAEEALEALLAALEGHPDVQEVLTNAGGGEEEEGGGGGGLSLSS